MLDSLDLEDVKIRARLMTQRWREKHGVDYERREMQRQIQAELGALTAAQRRVLLESRPDLQEALDDYFGGSHATELLEIFPEEPQGYSGSLPA